MNEESIEVKVAIINHEVHNMKQSLDRLEGFMGKLTEISERQCVNTEKLTQLIGKVEDHETAIDGLLVSKAWFKGVLAVVSILATTIGGTIAVVIELYINGFGS